MWLDLSTKYSVTWLVFLKRERIFSGIFMLLVHQTPPGYIPEHIASVTLTCRAIGDNVDLYWLRNSVVHNDSTFSLQGVTRSDTGRYTCIGRNNAGLQNSFDYYVKVQCKWFSEIWQFDSSSSAFFLSGVWIYLGSGCQAFIIHVLRSCASCPCTSVSFVSFRITSLQLFLSFGVQSLPSSMFSRLHACRWKSKAYWMFESIRYLLIVDCSSVNMLKNRIDKYLVKMVCTFARWAYGFVVCCDLRCSLLNVVFVASSSGGDCKHDEDQPISRADRALVCVLGLPRNNRLEPIQRKHDIRYQPVHHHAPHQRKYWRGRVAPNDHASGAVTLWHVLVPRGKRFRVRQCGAGIQW